MYSDPVKLFMSIHVLSLTKYKWKKIKSMQIVEYPKREEWQSLIQRPVLEQVSLGKTVKKIMDKVKATGDKAVKKMTKELNLNGSTIIKRTPSIFSKF